MANVNYRRISRRRRTPLGSSEIWLANDHLLLVTRHWWTEYYQRFRLSEIKSIVVAERPSVRGLQIVGLAAMLAVLTLLLLRPTPGRIVAAVPLSIILAAQLVDLWRGPYARTILTTAVNTVRLAPLNRMRGATAFLDVVVPLIEAAQGGAWVPMPPPLPGDERSQAGEPDWTMSGGPPFQPPPLPSPASSRHKLAEAILFGATLAIGLLVVRASSHTLPGAVFVPSWTLALVPVFMGVMRMFQGGIRVLRLLASIAALMSAVFVVQSAVQYFTALAAAARAGLNPGEAGAAAVSRIPGLGLLGTVLAVVGLLGLVLMFLNQGRNKGVA